jgi:hypothetical protein
MSTAEHLIDELINSDGPTALDALSDPLFLSRFFGDAGEIEKARQFFHYINGGQL